MVRRQHRRGFFAAVGAVGLIGLAALAGCAEDAGDGALRIIRNQAIEDDGGCVVSSSLTTNGRSGGTIEVASPADYVLTPVIQNYASSASNKLISQRTAFLEGARIDLSFANPDLFTAAELAALEEDDLLKFSIGFSAAVLPDSGTAGVGFSIVPAELLRRIQPKLAAAGNSTVINVRLRVFGEMGGGEVESESFFYPVTVCDSTKVPCVIASTFTCGATGVPTPRPGNACNPYQDGPVDCCVVSGTLTCPGVVGTAVQ
jgi:hypothetical protein